MYTALAIEVPAPASFVAMALALALGCGKSDDGAESSTDATSTGGGTTATETTGAATGTGSTDGTGGDTDCPPCVPPPSDDCVGQGPCGCGPYECPGDTDTGGGAPECAAPQDYEVPGCGTNPGEGEYGWNGAGCEWLDTGCGCTGTACESLYPTLTACEEAHADCLPVDCTDDASLCPPGYLCACGGPGPGPHACACGRACAEESVCTDPGQPVCCTGIVAGGGGACTDECTCFCD